MSWEAITLAFGGVAALAGLVYVGFSSGRKQTERAAKAEEKRDAQIEEMDRLVRFNKGERAGRDLARERAEQLKRLRERARRRRRDS